MIATTLGVLLSAEPVLQRLADLKVPVSTAYRIAKLCRAVADETRLFHEQRIALVKRYGEERSATPEEAARGETTLWQVRPDSLAIFGAEIQQLAAVPVVLERDPIDLASLGDVDISAADLMALGPLLADPDVAVSGA